MKEPRIMDLNADLGEGFPHDDALLDLVTSASISCGAHAGDRTTILATLRSARQKAIVVGAHPGFPDREGFGRRDHAMTTDQVEELILEQFATLERIADEVGVALSFVKPHGALYNQAQHETGIAQGIIKAVAHLKLPVLGQPGGVLGALARESDVRFVAEGFPDRRYGEDGRLLPRSHPNACLTTPEEVAEQVLALLERGFDTLCVHGDAPHAVENAALIRKTLQNRGILVGSFV